MTYVIAGLCGSEEKLTQMLDKIRLGDKDILYVIGDTVGTGSGCFDALNDLSMRPNVYPIAGERDYRALRMLSGFERMAKEGIQPDAAFISEMTEWAAKDGGREVLEEFRALDEDTREGILDYLSEMTLCEEVQAGGKKYLLLYAGIRGFDSGLSPEDYGPEAFFGGSFDLTVPYGKDITAVIGHADSSSATGSITRTDGFAVIDCHLPETDVLGCLCLDNGAEFYV